MPTHNSKKSKETYRDTLSKMNKQSCVLWNVIESPAMKLWQYRAASSDYSPAFGVRLTDTPGELLVSSSPPHRRTPLTMV